jgi:tetratricopeptide (TPR) repeat protein
MASRIQRFKEEVYNMKRCILAYGAVLLALALTLAIGATAQLNSVLSGQVFDLEGKPFPDVTVEIKSDMGKVLTNKTDKNGQFVQAGLQPGVYTITLKKEQTRLNYSLQFLVQSDKPNNVLINLKEIAAKQGIDVEAERKKQEEAHKQFENLKAHFDNGVAAMNQGNQLRPQLQGLPPDQQAASKAQMKGFYNTAATEFDQARQAAGEKDSNLPKIVANLGAAYEAAGQVSCQPTAATCPEYSKAVEAFQKATELAPTEGNYFVGLATNLARVGKIPEAGTACDKAAAINPANAGMCWRNIGIVLRNANKMKEAIEPLKKATEVDPKNPDGWYLLGASLLAGMDYKQEGDKITYIVLPGTADAYQKYLDLAPNGPHAQECKDALASLAALGQGVETKVSTRKKK